MTTTPTTPLKGHDPGASVRLEVFVPAVTKQTRTGRLTPAWMNSNNRYKHWAQKAALTKAWRQNGFVIARAGKLPRLSTATVTVYVHKTTRTSYDAGNLYPTVKAVIDGMVGSPRHPGYGLLPDDDNDHLAGPFIYPGDHRPEAGITLIIEGEPLD